MESDNEDIELQKLAYYWDTIFNEPRSEKKVLRVFIGGKSSSQLQSFHDAVSKLKFDSVDLQFMDTDTVRKLNWTPESLVNWLLESNVHIILSHIHQGLERLRWSMTDLLSQLQRLQFHKEYSTGSFLSCPIFTQDKYEFLSACKDINETMRIYINQDGDYNHIEKDIASFTTRYHEDHGWVLKTPFSTNRQNMKYPKSFEEIIVHLKYFSTKFYGLLPYVMLQPCLANKREYKVIMLNDKSHYVSKIGPRVGKSYSTYPHRELMSFANHAVILLKKNCPTVLTNILLRVDIFQRSYGRLVVNEFESLGACFYGSGQDESMTILYCSNTKEIQELFKDIFNLR